MEHGADCQQAESRSRKCPLSCHVVMMSCTCSNDIMESCEDSGLTRDLLMPIKILSIFCYSRYHYSPENVKKYLES